MSGETTILICSYPGNAIIGRGVKKGSTIVKDLTKLIDGTQSSSGGYDIFNILSKII